ncbi:CRISPR-associated endonuclease Cas2 [Halomonas sp.]|uniref:CRISPR-associated endonuclease Cas2 n=1 Tax=Halomonas sp. TaxID=1486246 RepID=UPI00385083B8
MSEPQWYLIAYDIRDPRRLRRVQHLLRTCSHPLQASVFAWEGSHRELQVLKKALEALIKPKEDDVRGYPVVSGHGILWWGAMPMPKDIVVENAPRIDLQAPLGQPDS